MREQLSGLLSPRLSASLMFPSCRGNADQREKPLDVAFARLSFDWTSVLGRTADAQLSRTHTHTHTNESYATCTIRSVNA